MTSEPDCRYVRTGHQRAAPPRIERITGEQRPCVIRYYTHAVEIVGCEELKRAARLFALRKCSPCNRCAVRGPLLTDRSTAPQHTCVGIHDSALSFDYPDTLL